MFSKASKHRKACKKGNESKQKEKHAIHTSRPLPSPHPIMPFDLVRSLNLSQQGLSLRAPSAHAGARQPVPSRAATRSDQTGQDGPKIVRAFRIARYLACIPIRVVKSGIDRGFLVSHRSGLAGQPASPNLLDFGTWDSPCLATCLSVPTCLPACRPTERTSRGLHSPRLGDAVTRSRRKGKKRDGLVGGREHNNAEKGDAGAEIIIPVRRCRRRGGGGPGSRSPPPHLSGIRSDEKVVAAGRACYAGFLLEGAPTMVGMGKGNSMRRRRPALAGRGLRLGRHGDIQNTDLCRGCAPQPAIPEPHMLLAAARP